jgi:two-component system, NarL family, sensor kinase
MFTNQQEASYSIILFTLFVLGLIAIIVIAAILYYNRRKKSQLEQEQLQHQFAQTLLQTQIEMQEQTLNKLSQEIHDNIGQVLSLAKINLNTLKAGETEKINSTKDLLTKAIHDLRHLSRSMLGEKIAEMGLPNAIEQELKAVEISGQLSTRFHIHGHVLPLDAQRTIILFRIVQEAISNAIKHAGATRLTIELDYTSSHLLITIADDGKGFDQAALDVLKTGIGLKNMQNRTALIKGRFDIQSTPDSGTKISITIDKA